MEAVLHAPENERIDMLYTLIRQVPDFLQAFDERQFIDTPLHLAAGEGLTLLALEIQRLMPSFGKKLNADGFSPLHLALLRGHNETARAMTRLNPELIGVQGREGITPLHCAAEMDDDVDGAVNILVEFLLRCPESIEKLTVREETAVHVAVKSRKLASLNVLVGWLMMTRKGRVLGCRDFEGNTALHLAASTNQTQVMRTVLDLWVDVNVKNNEGLTTLDLVMRLPNHENAAAIAMLPRRRAKTGASISRTPIADYFSPVNMSYFPQRLGVLIDYLHSDITDRMRSDALVVAGLIATAAYQGVLTPPRIVSSSQTTPITLNITSYFANTTTPALINVLEPHQAHNITKSELRDRDLLYAVAFMLPNSWALAASLGMIYLLLPLRLSISLIHASLLFLMASTYMMLACTYWSEPDLKVGTLVGSFSFFIVFVLVVLAKIASTHRKFVMKRLI